MLVKASVSQMCIKKNKKIDVVMKIALSETKAGCKALMTFCPESDFTEELNSKLKDTYLMELSVKREYVYIQHLLILSNSIFTYSCVTISTSTCKHMLVEQTLNGAPRRSDRSKPPLIVWNNSNKSNIEVRLRLWTLGSHYPE